MEDASNDWSQEESVSQREGAAGAMTKFEGSDFRAKKNFFSFLSQKFEIYGPRGGLRFYVSQAAFRAREEITVYGDRHENEEVMKIEARNIIDFSAAYDVTTPAGEQIGVLKRHGMKSMFRDEWSIADASGRDIGKIQEDSAAKAMLRRFLLDLIPQTFHITVDGAEVATIRQQFNPFILKYDIRFEEDGRLDPRLGIAAVVCLLAIEGRQSDD